MLTYFRKETLSEVKGAVCDKSDRVVQIFVNDLVELVENLVKRISRLDISLGEAILLGNLD